MPVPTVPGRHVRGYAYASPTLGASAIRAASLEYDMDHETKTLVVHCCCLGLNAHPGSRSNTCSISVRDWPLPTHSRSRKLGRERPGVQVGYDYWQGVGQGPRRGFQEHRVGSNPRGVSTEIP